MSISNRGEATICLHVKSKLINKLGLQVLTTLLDNTCNLKVILCDKEVKDSFIVDKKVSAVDEIQYNLQSICWNAFIFELDHFLVRLFHSVSKHGVKIIAAGSEHNAMNWEYLSFHFLNPRRWIHLALESERTLTKEFQNGKPFWNQLSITVLRYASRRSRDLIWIMEISRELWRVTKVLN